MKKISFTIDDRYTVTVTDILGKPADDSVAAAIAMALFLTLGSRKQKVLRPVTARSQWNDKRLNMNNLIR